MINTVKKESKQKNKEVEQELILTLITWDLRKYLANFSEEEKEAEEPNSNLIWAVVVTKNKALQALVALVEFLIPFSVEEEMVDLVAFKEVNKEENKNQRMA